jgi:hypothetical protein
MAPFDEVGLRCDKAEQFADEVVKSFFVKFKGDLIDGVFHIASFDDRLYGHVTEERYFVTNILIEIP